MNRNRRVMVVIIVIGAFIILSLAGVFYLVSQNSTTATTPTNGDDGGPVTTNGGDGQTQPNAEATLPNTLDVIISIQTVPRGFVLTEAEVDIDQRLAAEVGPNVITNIDDVLGKIARTDIFQGETLTTDKLASDITEIGTENFGPSSLIPFGTMAIAVPMDRLSSVAYGLAEGDSIDIMLSFAINEIDEQFRTLLQNSVTFYLAVAGEDGELRRTTFVIDPYGRFETLPTGDVVHIAPSEDQRAAPVSIILQNAKVIQVGPWTPPEPLKPPTPTPDPNAPTPTPGGPPPTPTPRPPDVLLLALEPQQQLFLKYAVENGSDIDYALRAASDGQLNEVENVDLSYLLGRFNIEVPPDSGFAVDPNAFKADGEESGTSGTQENPTSGTNE